MRGVSDVNGGYRGPFLRGARFLPPLLLLLLLGVLWQLWTVTQRVPDFLLPGPVAIWQATWLQHDLLLNNTLPTLEIAVFGFVFALALGFFLAVAIRFSHALELILYPIVIASQTVPVVALAPILVVLLGFTVLPKLIVVCLICFFPIVVNTVDGFRGVDRDLINMMRTLGASRWRLFRDVELPSALPYLFSGAKVAVTFSVVGALFGEWVGSSEGLGWLMIQEQAQLDTAMIFSAIAMLILMGVGLFVLVVLAERLLLPWHRPETDSDALIHRL